MHIVRKWKLPSYRLTRHKNRLPLKQREAALPRKSVRKAPDSESRLRLKRISLSDKINWMAPSSESRLLNRLKKRLNKKFN